MIIKKASEVSFCIYIAGDFNRAVHLCESFCLQGFCVTVDKTTFVYKYGVERGVKVGIINYARFPLDAETLLSHAKDLGNHLMLGLNQGSFSIVGNDQSWFCSRRDGDSE